jgi:hypothetical protein
MMIPYNVTPPSIKFNLGNRSPKDARRTELQRAPTPIALRRSPWPVAPTLRMSRANTGKRVINGIINRDAKTTIRRLARTASFCQLNFHPSMMLRPKEFV